MRSLVNIHWFSRDKLRTLLYEDKLYRGSSGIVKIKNARELTGQVIRKSVWVNPEHVGIEVETKCRPKGSMCAVCKGLNSQLKHTCPSPSEFKTMPQIGKDSDGMIVVRCTGFERT